MTDITAFLAARLDEDEVWAHEASRYRENPVPDGGLHWQWVNPRDDQVVVPNPGEDDILDGDVGYRVALRSVEEFPSRVGPLPQFAIPTAEEIPSAVGGHIVRHDPARVLAEVKAKRRVLERHSDDGHGGCEGCGYDYADISLRYDINDCPELRDLAAPYDQHPDYDPAWRVE